MRDRSYGISENEKHEKKILLTGGEYLKIKAG
jgi:hypothetical protein